MGILGLWPKFYFKICPAHFLIRFNGIVNGPVFGLAQILRLRLPVPLWQLYLLLLLLWLVPFHYFSTSVIFYSSTFEMFILVFYTFQFLFILINFQKLTILILKNELEGAKTTIF